MGNGYYLSVERDHKKRKGPKGLHVAVFEFYSGKEVPKGYHIHHKDCNPRNNYFDNLECLLATVHRKMPTRYTEKRKRQLEKIRPLAAKWHGSAMGKKWHSKNSKRM